MQLSARLLITAALLSSTCHAFSAVKAPSKVLPLSRANLDEIKAEGLVCVPNFKPADLKGGILQIGVGNFFRAFLCQYTDDILNQDFDNNKDFGIVGAGLYSPRKRTQLQPQDYLQTLVKQDGVTAEPTVLGSMIDYLPLGEDADNKFAPIQDMLSNDPDLKIVALTVTEGGYYLYDGHFNLEDPDIAWDIANVDKPKTIFGMMLKALQYRKEKGMPAFTIMSCDNLPHNGDVVKKIILGMANLCEDAENCYVDFDFAEWIDDNVSFPNAMVDRIAPATTEALQEKLKSEFGVADEIPVPCEPFRQWVIEDNFCQGRPAWEQVKDANIIITEDVGPYELMKIRILNGGHASLSYAAALLDLEYVHEAMEHDVIGPFLDTIEKCELIPTVPPVPDTDLIEYWGTTAERFSNPTLLDTIGRNTYDGASRQPKFIVPVAADALKIHGEKKANVEGLALVSAMWCRYCQGTTESGKEVPSTDPIWERLQATAEEAKTDPNAWLAMKDIYGDEVGKSRVFQQAFAKALNTINTDGVETALKNYIADHAEMKQMSQ